MKNSYKRIYREYSTGETFSDSTAYGTEELGNPGVIHFYKQYKDHISLEMLRLYHHMHHYFTNIKIPDLKIHIEYKGKKYCRMIFSILDLDPQGIYTASDKGTGKKHRVTQPMYILGDELSSSHKILSDSAGTDTIANIKSHLRNFFYRNGVYLGTRIDIINNMKVISVSGDSIHVVITDIGSYIQELCIDNVRRANNTIPSRYNTKIETREELNATLLGHTDYTPIL